MVTGAGVLRYQNNDTTRTRRHPRPFRPYSQEHARVLRVRAHPRAGAGATRTRLLPWLQGYPRFKNLSSGGKSLELCADVASDVGIKAKSRLLRFL